MGMGISPYITDCIVFHLLQMVFIQLLKEWGEQGEAGKQKINRLTRIVALILAFIQSLVLLLGLGAARGGALIPRILEPSIVHYIYMSLIITAGTAIAIFIGDLITKYGIGNGTSMLIVAGIVTSLPAMVTQLWTLYIKPPAGEALDIFLFILIMVLNVAVLIGVTYLELAKENSIQYANVRAGRGKTDSNLPIKLNTAGVIPVIFASTILSIPLSILGMMDDSSSESGVGYWLSQIFNYQNPIGFVLYMVLIMLFAFFYSFLMFNPESVAENLSKSNAYIPGIRPGEDTTNYISRLLFKITVLGTVYLMILAALPIVTTIIFGFKGTVAQSVTIGTSLIIVVGVALETVNQIITQSTEQEYKRLF